MTFFTPRQVTDMLEIPPSTLRRYVSDFADHLSADATKPRGRRYSESDVLVLQRARELLRQGQPVDQVNQLLGVLDDPEAAAEVAPADTLALVPAISERLDLALRTAQGLRGDLDTLADNQAETADRLDILADWIATPWYRRIGKRPPFIDQGTKKDRAEVDRF